MISSINNLKELKAFVAKRPQLKAKVEETLATMGVTYDKPNPIIEKLDVRGGSAHYTDDGNSVNGNYVRSDATLQEIEFTVRLINGDGFYVTVSQKLRVYTPVTRVTYRGALYGGKRGKQPFVEALAREQEKFNNGVNPYQADYDSTERILKNAREIVVLLKAELAVLKPLKETVPEAYRAVEDLIRNQGYKVDRATENFNRATKLLNGESAY